MTSRYGPAEAFTILLVCTGNICRSALAERLGLEYLREQLGADAAAVRLVSAGTRAVVGSAMHPDTAMVLRGFGAEAGDFRARQLHGVLVSNADLTLTMTRDHRRAVLEQAPGALASTFTVREAAALMAGIGGEAQFPGPTFQYRARAFVGALAGQRARRGADREDDVPDPIGQPVAFQQDVGEMIVAALLPILGRLAGLAAPAPGTSHDAPAG